MDKNQAYSQKYAIDASLRRATISDAIFSTCYVKSNSSNLKISHLVWSPRQIYFAINCMATRITYGRLDQQQCFALRPLPQGQGSFRPTPRHRASDSARSSAIMASGVNPRFLSRMTCLNGCSAWAKNCRKPPQR